MHGLIGRHRPGAEMQDTRYKRPESVLVVVYTAAGEVLLLRRREPADFWQSVTGSLHWDESPSQAARRELKEETGLDKEPVDCAISHCFPILPAWRARYAPDVTENTEHLFGVALDKREPVHLNPLEHVEYRWLSRREALASVASWTNREAIQFLVPH